MTSKKRTRTQWLRRDHLYGALLWNVLPPIVVLVLMLGFVLGLVYASGIFGGQAWIESANQGAVPQIFRFVEDEGRRCAYEEARSGSSSCTTDQNLSDDIPASPAIRITSQDLNSPTLALFDTSVDSEIFRALLRGKPETSGFAALEGRLVHVDKLMGGDFLLVRDVTEGVLQRMSRAGAVEVELFGVDDKRLFATTFRGMDNQPLFTVGEPPHPEMTSRAFEFTQPYRGYVSRLQGGESYLYGGMWEFQAFARWYEPQPVPGLPKAAVVISVPQKVMLGYTNWMIIGSCLLGALVIGWTVILLRRLTFQQIQPIVELSERIHFMGVAMRDEEETIPQMPSRATELESLQYAVSLLEETFRENRRLEKRIRQNERLEAIGRLTGGIAHDFNNLLGIVVANCGFLEEDVDDPQLLESIEDISAAARSASEMTASLLAFSAGRNVQVDGGRDIAQEVRTAVKLVSRSIGSDVEVTLDVVGPSLAAISGAQLQQLILNLVLNARDAAGEQGIRVEVCLGPASQPPAHRPKDFAANWLCLSVKDNGVGMSEEVLGHIFEPFYTNKKFSSQRGTGLGLSVVYGIVESIGGYVDVESKEGVGTTFRIYIPRSESHSQNDAGAEQQVVRAMSVILVEDDHGVRRAVRSMLSRMGMTVTDFESGLLAGQWLADATAEDIDLLLTDIRMPGMDGYEVAESFRARFPSLPVLFMTGYDADASRRQQMVNSRLLMKPMRRDDLAEALQGLTAG